MNTKKRLFTYGMYAALLLYWIAMTFLFNNRLSFSVISFPQSFQSTGNVPNQTLRRGDVVRFEFTAREEHLGIIYVRFNKPPMVGFQDEDRIAFRLIRKEGNERIEEGMIRSGLIRKSPFIPFGFTPIDGSKSNVYILELESLAGSDMNGVSLSSFEPRIVTAYKFSRGEITASPKRFVSFMIQRNLEYFSSFRSMEIVSVLLIYLVPFVIFFIRNMGGSLTVSRRRTLSAALILLSALLYTTFITLDEIPTIVLLQTCITWVFLLFVYFLPRTMTLLTSFIWLMLGVTAIALQPSGNIFAQKSSVWFYIFLLIAVFQSLYEELTEGKKRPGRRKGAMQ